MAENIRKREDRKTRREKQASPFRHRQPLCNNDLQSHPTPSQDVHCMLQCKNTEEAGIRIIEYINKSVFVVKHPPFLCRRKSLRLDLTVCRDKQTHVLYLSRY